VNLGCEVAIGCELCEEDDLLVDFGSEVASGCELREEDDSLVDCGCGVGYGCRLCEEDDALVVNFGCKVASGSKLCEEDDALVENFGCEVASGCELCEDDDLLVDFGREAGCGFELCDEGDCGCKLCEEGEDDLLNFDPEAERIQRLPLVWPASSPHSLTIGSDVPPATGRGKVPVAANSVGKKTHSWTSAVTLAVAANSVRKTTFSWWTLAVKLAVAADSSRKASPSRLWRLRESYLASSLRASTSVHKKVETPLQATIYMRVATLLLATIA
jgi:hypothetical protein